MRLGRGRGRTIGGVLAAAVLAGAAVVVWSPWDGGGGGHQSADEIAALTALPDGVTPLDPAQPNPTGNDPSVVGTPPEVAPAATPEAFLARAEQLRDAAVTSDQATKGPGTGLAGEAGQAGAPPAPGPQTDEGSLLVEFAAGTSVDAMAAALDAAGVEGTPIAGTSVAEVAVPDDGDDDGDGGDAAAITAALEDVGGVESVDPNLVRSIARQPNDPEYAGQSPSLGTVHVPQAWDVADTRASVTVAVLDTGVDLDHPDLVPNLVAGYDVVNGDTDPSDDNGHGTQVAGIIGAATSNGAGVAGVAWNARIMPVKVLDATGTGSDAEIAEGIVWATDHGAQVINMSLGGAGTSVLIDQAVAYAIAHEVVLVAAAGNDAALQLDYPAAAPGVYGVTATDATGRFAWFSNHGPWYYLSAPGIAIRSTALSDGPAPAYGNGTGTSFSSPIVAGVMALVRERHPGWGWFEVGDEVLRTARDLGPAGLDDAYGFGLLDASAALGVSPIAGVSQPNRTGDAGDLPSAARSLSVGAPATESINYEYDEDWFAFTVPSAGGATITVTPPPASSSDRAAEMDPVVDLYGPGGGLLAHMDQTFVGEAEQLRENVGPGRHTLEIGNWFGATSPGPYSVLVTLGAPLPATAWAPPQIEYSVGAWEESVAVADFTGDGRDDVVLGTSRYFDPDNDNKLFAFGQEADGTLSAPQKLDTHASRSGDPLQPADIDGDGDVDLVRGTAAGLDVAWNDGDGLTPPVLSPTDGDVRGIRVADIDGTGPVELIVQGGGSLGELTAFRWENGAFTSEGLGFAPSGIGTLMYDLADLTGDGRLDVVTFAGNDVALHAQQPDGSWAVPVTVDLPEPGVAFPDRAVVTGDISNDGRADIVALVGPPYGTDIRLSYRLQQPGGGFGPPVTLAASQTGTMKIADVTADGRADVVVFQNGGTTAVYEQTAGRGLAPEERIGGFYATWVGSPDSMAIGDLDSDGVNDVAVGSYNAGLYVHRHQSAAAVEGPGPWVVASAPAEHATGVAASVRPTVTFGRDVDEVSAVAGETVWLVDGRNGRAVDVTLSLFGRTMTVRPRVALTPGVPYQVWIAGVTSGNGTQVAYERIPFTVAAGAAPSYSVNGTYVPFRVDLDGNGYDDVFWYGPGSAADSVWFFGPDGRTSAATAVNGTYTPVAGDFDGNGYEDVFWYGPGSATDVMWRNGRNGIVAVAMPVNGTYVPVAGDFDGNGYDDVLWYGPGSAADSVWYFGLTGRSVVAKRVTGSTYRPVAGDFTRDGFDDVAWYAPGAAGEILWRGSRTGFTSVATLSITKTYRGKALDFNADGFDEVYLYATNQGRFWRSSPSGFTSVQNAPPLPAGGRPVAGDFTGDARDDLFNYVPGTAADRFYRGNATGVA